MPSINYDKQNLYNIGSVQSDVVSTSALYANTISAVQSLTVNTILSGDGTNLSNKWNAAYSFSNANSSTILGDLSAISVQSAYWDLTYTTVATNSASWVSSTDTVFAANSAKYETSYSFLTSNSAFILGSLTELTTLTALILGDLTDVATSSADWDNVYTWANSYSGFIFGDLQNIATTSAYWNDTYTQFSTNSASYATQGYVHQNFLPLSGNVTLSGDLGVGGNLTVYGLLCALSGFNFFGVTIFTSTSSLSIINEGSGPALYVRQVGAVGNIATFGDTDGTVLYVDRDPISPVGYVGINTEKPQEALTVVGNISATGIIFSVSGNSEQWNSVYSYVNSNSAYIVGDLTDLATTSAKWNTAYTYVNSKSAYIEGAITDVADSSATWDAAWTFSSSNSALILGDLTNIATASGNYNTAVSFLTSNSALILGDLTHIAVNSAKWDTSYSYLTANSATTQAVVSTVNILSSYWNDAYTYNNATSALVLGDLTVVATNSSFWGGGGSSSAVVAANSAFWTAGYTFANGNSALILGDLTNIANTSASWNNVYTAYNAQSGNLVLSANSNAQGLIQIYQQNGNTITVDTKLKTTDSPSFSSLTVFGNLSVLGDLTYLDTTVTVTSALSVVNLGTGPALTIKQAGIQPVATFIDAEGGYITISDTGKLGINTETPNEKLTVIGNVSATGRYYALDATSDQWTTAYTFANGNSALIFGDLTVLATNSAYWGLGGSGSTVYALNSAKYETAYSFLTANSSTILGDLSAIATTSAYWNAAYTFTNNNSALILGDLTVVATNSASWGSGGTGSLVFSQNSAKYDTAYTFLTANSSTILGDLSVIATTSANWDKGYTAYTFLTANSSTILGDLSAISVVSGNWDAAYTFTNSNSALILGDLTNIAVTSANWNTAYTFNNSTSSLILGDLTVVATNSAYWGGGGAGSAVFSANSAKYEATWNFTWYNSASLLSVVNNVTANSANWSSAYTFANSNSALILGDLTKLAMASSYWDLTYTTVANNSAFWSSPTDTVFAVESAKYNTAYSFLTSNSALILGDLSAVATTSANWDKGYTAYTFLTSNSALILGDLTNISVNSAKWDASWTFSSNNSALILGDLTVVATNSASWGSGGSGAAVFGANSAKYETAYSFLTANSSTILGDLSAIATTSAYWNAAYNYANGISATNFAVVSVVTRLSGDWNSAYSFTNGNSSLILGDLTVLATNSAYWATGGSGSTVYSLNSAKYETSYSFLTSNSALILGDLTDIATTSAKWNTSYTFNNSTSALILGDLTDIATTSAKWNTSYTFNNTTSALILGDLTDIATTSAKWNSAYSFSNSNSALILGDLTVVATNSASWGSGGSGSLVFAQNSAKYETAYSFLTANSATILGDLTDIATTSAKWNSAYSFSNGNSALLIGGHTDVATNSAKWNSAYSFSNSNSALILGDLTVVATNSASWGAGGSSSVVLATNSARWDAAWSFSSGNSALILGDLTNIAGTSATWNAAWSFSSANSALILGDLTNLATTSGTFVVNGSSPSQGTVRLTTQNGVNIDIDTGLQNADSPLFNNLTVNGNLSVLGDFTYVDTTVTVTSALSVINLGTGPALTVKQSGIQPVATFIDAEGGYTTVANNGWLGVKTQTPNVELTVVGNISATGTVYGTLCATSIPAFGSDKSIQFNQSGLLAGNTGLVYDYTNTRVGINTNVPQTTLDVNGSLSADGILYLTDSLVGNYIEKYSYFASSSLTSPFGASTYFMGMSASTSNRRLFIDNRNSDGLATDPAGGITFRTGGTPSDRMHIAYNGRVGINTTSPSTQLQVNGTFASNALWTDSSAISYWGNYSTAYGVLTWNTGYASIYSTASNRLDLGAGGTQAYVTIGTTGNVGIGENTPNSKLTVGTSFASLDGISVQTGSGSVDSAFVARKAASMPAFSVLPWNSEIYLGGGVYYDGGGWVHNSNNTSSFLLTLQPGSGVRWYASSNSSASWNVASNVQLWNDSGYWTNLVQSSINSTNYFTGTLGVGVVAPQARLEVGGATANAIFVTSTNYPTQYITQLGVQTGAQGILVLGNNAVNEIRAGNTGTGGYLDIYTNNTANWNAAANGTLVARFTNGGKLAIGGTSVDTSALMQVYGVISSKQYQITDTAATAQWVRIGTFTAPQGGYTCRIQAYIHAGYNALNTQDFSVELFFKTSNGSSVNASGFAGNAWFTTIGYSGTDVQAKWVANTGGVAATSYTLYLFLPAFTLGSQYIAYVGTTPTGWTDNQALGQVDPGANSTTVCVASKDFNVMVGNVGIGTNAPGYKLEVNGTFAATSKSFVIKHPTKEGKKLQHGVVEGPEHSVYVRGKTTSDVIELPDYWVKLVDEETITVQLTPIGSHQDLVVIETSGNKVKIKNQNLIKKSINCYYYIQATRKDIEPMKVEY